MTFLSTAVQPQRNMHGRVGSDCSSPIQKFVELLLMRCDCEGDPFEIEAGFRWKVTPPCPHLVTIETLIIQVIPAHIKLKLRGWCMILYYQISR